MPKSKANHKGSGMLLGSGALLVVWGLCARLFLRPDLEPELLRDASEDISLSGSGLKYITQTKNQDEPEETREGLEKLQYRDAARSMDLEELNMDEESDPEQRELDEHEQEEQAAELARKRMKHEEVEAMVQKGLLPRDIETKIESGPLSVSREQHPVIRFSADRPAEEFKMQLDSQEWVSVRSPLRLRRPLGEGAHVVRVAAVDTRGFIDPTPAEMQWTVDLTPPRIVWDRFPADPSNQVPAVFVARADEAGCQWRWSIDARLNQSEASHPQGPGPAAASPQKQRWTAATDLEELVEVEHPTNLSVRLVVAGLEGTGLYRFRIAAADLAGNMAKTRTVVWTVDLDPPETKVISGPGQLTSSPDAAFLLSCPSEKSDTYRYQFRYDHFPGLARAPTLRNSLNQTGPGSETSGWTSGRRWSSDGASFALAGDLLTVQNLQEGPHKIEIRAVDQAGNHDVTPEVYSWVIHKGPPRTIFLTKPTRSTCSSSAFFQVESTQSQCMYEYKVNDRGSAVWPAGRNMTRGVLNLTLSGLAQGDHSVHFRCTDITGVREPKPAVWKWTVGVCYRNEPNSLPSNSSDQQPEASLLREGGPEQDLVSSKGQQRLERSIEWKGGRSSNRVGRGRDRIGKSLDLSKELYQIGV